MKSAVSGLLLLVLLVGRGFAATRVVPDSYATIAAAMSAAQAGDTVLVNAGTYAEDINTVRNGTQANPITVDGQKVASVLAANLFHSWIRIQNFTITGKTTANSCLLYMDRGADNCILSNNIVDGNYAASVSGVRFNTPDAIPFGNAASDNLFIANTLQHFGGTPVFTIHGDRNTISSNLLRDCDAIDWFDVWGRTNLIIGNICSNFVYSGTFANHPDCVQSFGSSGIGAYNIVIERNIFASGSTNLQISMFSSWNCDDLSDFTFRNNLFVDIPNPGSCPIRNVRWYNNLFYRCGTVGGGGSQILNFGTYTNATYTNLLTCSSHGCEVMNNTFLECGGTNTYTGWYSFATNPPLNNVVSDYNFISKSGYAAVPVNPLHAAVGEAGADIFSWWEHHGINGGNPLLTDPSNFDFHLQAGSPLILAGTNLYALFTTDMAGLSRPSSGGWDIGPFQFNGTTNLMRVTNVRVGVLIGK